MCRLFAMSGGQEPVSATFWLLDAADSLEQQSRKNPDGTGLGWFDPAGAAHVEKAPIAGYEDAEFMASARSVTARTFIAHVRYATHGAHTMANTHPFEQDGRLFAHNGVLAGLDQIEARLGPDAAMIAGETDSERLCTLITHEIRAAGGDVRAGIISAVRWLAGSIELFSINFVLTTAEEVWAFRYPEHNTLFVLERASGGGGEPLAQAGAEPGIRVASGDFASRSAVVVASEPMDDDPRWRPIASGELVHVAADLAVTTELIVDHEPRHPQVLGPAAAVAQSPA